MSEVEAAIMFGQLYEMLRSHNQCIELTAEKLRTLFVMIYTPRLTRDNFLWAADKMLKGEIKDE